MKTLFPETAVYGSDFELFLERMAPLPYREILTRCRGTIARTNPDHSERMNPKELWFATRVHEFYLFLTTGKLLNSAKADAACYRPVIAALVARHELHRSFLAILDEAAVGGELRPPLNRGIRPQHGRERSTTLPR